MNKLIQHFSRTPPMCPFHTYDWCHCLRWHTWFGALAHTCFVCLLSCLIAHQQSQSYSVALQTVGLNEWMRWLVVTFLVHAETSRTPKLYVVKTSFAALLRIGCKGDNGTTRYYIGCHFCLLDLERAAQPWSYSSGIFDKLNPWKDMCIREI